MAKEKNKRPTNSQIESEISYILRTQSGYSRAYLEELAGSDPEALRAIFESSPADLSSPTFSREKGNRLPDGRLLPHRRNAPSPHRQKNEKKKKSWVSW